MSAIGVMSKSARGMIREGTQRLAAAGIPSAQREAEWLLSHLVRMPPLELYLQDAMIPDRTTEQFFAHLEARIAGTPLQYLLGATEFFGQRFVVEPGVFIPRPETETVVEAALEALRIRQQQCNRPLRLLDLGTGSGCIAVTLARLLPACVVVGVEVSWSALRVARHNILQQGVGGRAYLMQGYWTEALRGTWDGIISNPPYVPTAQVDRLPLDVRQEPRLSLDGGAKGTRELMTLFREASRLLAAEGIFVVECGEEQVPEFLQLAEALQWVKHVRSLRDLVGRPRGLIVTRRA